MLSVQDNYIKHDAEDLPRAISHGSRDVSVVHSEGTSGAKPLKETTGQDTHYTSTSTTTRRNANGSVSSVYSGNKIRYLKKDDGQPLWRSDIQYNFLKLVFEDEHKVFTLASDGSTGHTFAEIYIDAMAKSSKTSQILKDKLLNDRAAAVSMAMICLLVNVGRMNTTLNCQSSPQYRKISVLTRSHSLPRNAGKSSHLPLDSLPTSTSKLQRI